ncbi:MULTISPECIES: sulfatase-like hydrolase/transferase [Microcella]|uniref:sulfatase-like hydrolase/transferase n=1 Tax=Microcella TaxID=337004 RepID=UPI0015CF51A4|nr:MULTISPECIES: sulfatase-like hydrolase/transferase [Microcella]QOD93372.1 sulfatase-like hydrolase/transferase [Chryseoglobus sp. 28M-23]
MFILADDMGFGDFGVFNGGQSSTPQLDDLSGISRLYSQHTSASPVCAPARAALLTGRYPQRTGVIDTLEARGTDRLALDEFTIADAFSRAGAVTGLVGKWHCGAIGEPYHPLKRGFDEFIGFRGGWQDYWDWTLERNRTPVQADGRYLTDVLGDEAVGFIRRHKHERFFLHVSFNAPHFPYQAPEELIGQHRRTGRTERVAVIYAMIAVMDRAIGRIRQAISDAGLDDDTLIVVTSDNGPELGGDGEESADRWNVGLRGAKQHVFEGGIRLPLVLSQPGVVAAGEDDTFIHLTDWYPSLLTHAGVTPVGSKVLDGRDISGSFTGGTVDDVPRCWQWSRYHPMPTSNAAIRDGRWKLVHPAAAGTLGLTDRDEWIDHDIKRHPENYAQPIDEESPGWPAVGTEPMLFDLAADPEEAHDLAAVHPDVRARLATALHAWYEDVELDRARLVST